MIGRRKFLQKGLDLGIAAVAFRPLALSANGLPPLGPAKWLAKSKLFIPEGQGVALAKDKGPNSAYAMLNPPVLEGMRIWDGATQTIQDLNLRFGGHGLAITKAGTFAVVFEKWGQNACILNLKNGDVRAFAPYPGAEFYGHGAITTNDTQFLAAEVDIETGKSLISVRDIKTGQVADVWKYEGVGLHDLAISESQGVVLAPFSGRQMEWRLEEAIPRTAVRKISDSYLALIDLRTGKIREQLKLKNPDLSLTHVFVDPIDDKRFYLGTTPRSLPNFYGSQAPDISRSASLSPVFGSLGSEISEANLPPQLKDQLKIELINVAVDEANDMVAFTASLAGYVLLYRRSTMDFLKSIKFDAAISGILAVPGAHAFLVTALGHRGSWWVSAKSKDLGNVSESDIQMGRGSHLYVCPALG